MRIKHILVHNKYEAEDLLRFIHEGKSFEELATKYSTCPSAPQGGDLGEVQSRRLDPDFLEAAEILKSGQISKVPVRTRFGYHLIKREY